MRSKCVWVMLCALAGGLTIGCVTSATDDEIESMCNNLIQLRGNIANPDVETIAGDITMKFEQETKQLQDYRTGEQKVLQEEMQAELEAAKTDDEKDRIKKEYAAKQEEIATKYKPDLDAVNAKKANALAEAKKQAEENRSVWSDAVNECAQQAKKEGVSQKVARCRIEAKTTDRYWNGCR